MKKLLIILFLTIVLVPFDKVYAIPGCCSHHGGEAGCRGRQTLCNDGTVSSCVCDGTSGYSGGDSSDNDDKIYDNDDENDYTGILCIGIVVFFLSFPIYASTLGSQDRKRDKYEKRKKEAEEKEKKRLEEKMRTLLNYTIDNNDYSMLNNNDEIDERLLSIITSDDLIRLVDLKNENIFPLFETIYQNNSFVSKLIFDDLVCALLSAEKIDKFQIKCIEYILKNNYITKYEDIFLLSFEHNHLMIIYYILDNCKNFEYTFNTNDRNTIFRYLLEIDDLKIAEKISKKQVGLEFQSGLSILNEYKKQNTRNTYKILSLLYKNNKKLFLDIEKYIDEKIDFSDDNLVLDFVDTIAKVDGLIEESGYYIIFNLTKKCNYEVIYKIMEKYRDINLNKRIKVAKSKYFGMTPLIYACYRKSRKIVNLLLDYGADINFADINGNTSLEYACLLKYQSIVRILYDRGARLKENEDNIIIEKGFSTHDKYFLWEISLINIQKLKELRKKRK